MIELVTYLLISALRPPRAARSTDHPIDQHIAHQITRSRGREIDHQLTTSPDHQILFSGLKSQKASHPGVSRGRITRQASVASGSGISTVNCHVTGEKVEVFESKAGLKTHLYKPVQSSRDCADTPCMLTRNHVVVISALLGVALELGVDAMSGRREAWDSAEYWTVGLPVVALLTMALGYLSSERAFLWTFAVVPAQVLTMIVRSGDLGFNLWPLTVALSAILSAPFVIAASIGVALRRRTRPDAVS